MAGPLADAAMIRKILVAIDGSEHALRAARLAADLALRYDADLHLVQVVQAPPRLVLSKQLQEFAEVEKIDVPTSFDVTRYLLGPAESIAEAAGVRKVFRDVLTGDPAERLLEHTKDKGIDLIVLGRRGLGRVSGLLMGSVSLKVNSLAECPVLTVK
jgi:nucleotide-binding universal stress UspA family protein